ncbi:hypothetical protein ACHAWF_007591 [Thalassiosira exigua]
MRKLNSTTSASRLSPSSSEPVCDLQKLNFLAFAGTLVYIGYLLGGIDNGRDANTAVGTRSFDDGSEKDTTTYLRATSEDPTPKVISTKQPIVHNEKGPYTSINLIGERHSGTKWIKDHLQDCFGDRIPVKDGFIRTKHWFQFDDATLRNDSALAIALFRDPYDWTESMRKIPHHAHEHIGLEWKDFVTKPLVGPRGANDRAKMEKANAEGFQIGKWECLAGYDFDEVVPCSLHDYVKKEGYSGNMYELNPSGIAYGSIVQLRAAKIRNFLQVSEFHGVKAFFMEQYEALTSRGTAYFLSRLEQMTGVNANCTPFNSTGVAKHYDVTPEFIEWMNRYHDWDAEAMIGYARRDPGEGLMPRKSFVEDDSLPERLLPDNLKKASVADDKL